MSRSNPIEGLLFWVMALLGGAALAPCLILPPWLEYQAQLERRKAADAYVRALKQNLDTAQKQIEHLRNDPAYIMRLGEQEFGDSIHLPKVETVLIAPSPDSADDSGLTPETNPAAAANEPELVPELSAFFERVLRQYPHAWLFVNSSTRPVLMSLGAALLVTAVVLLGRAGLREPRLPAET